MLGLGASMAQVSAAFDVPDSIRVRAWLRSIVARGTNTVVRVLRRGFCTEQPILGDGNCLFTAVAHQLRYRGITTVRG